MPPPVILDDVSIDSSVALVKICNNLTFLVLDRLSSVQILNGDDILQRLLGAGARRVDKPLRVLFLRLISSDVEHYCMYEYRDTVLPLK